MASVRLLTTEDIPASRKLWQDRFGDSDRFMDWYYRDRFVPGLSCGVFCDDGALICQAHGRPLLLKAGGTTLSTLMIGGVSTEKSHEKQGYMHRVLNYLNDLASDDGYDALFLAAEHPEIYHSSGFIDCGSCVSVVSDGREPDSCETYDFANDTMIEKLFTVYQRVAFIYYYAPVRNFADMKRHTLDFLNAGYRLRTISRDNELVGYSFYDVISNSCEEAFAYSSRDYRRMVGSLPSGTSVFLPPDQADFGQPHVLSLIKPLKDLGRILTIDASAGYCPETY